MLGKPLARVRACLTARGSPSASTRCGRSRTARAAAPTGRRSRRPRPRRCGSSPAGPVQPGLEPGSIATATSGRCRRMGRSARDLGVARRHRAGRRPLRRRARHRPRRSSSRDELRAGTAGGRAAGAARLRRRGGAALRGRHDRLALPRRHADRGRARRAPRRGRRQRARAARADYRASSSICPSSRPRSGALRAHAEIHIAQRRGLRTLGVVERVAAPAPLRDRAARQRRPRR